VEMSERPPEIFIPEEVRPLYLVALPADLPAVYAEAQDIFARYRELPYRTLLAQAELLYHDAWGVRDRHVAALARLYQADLYQRLGERTEALSASHMSAKWLALQVPAHARYQEAVARYFGGILWYLDDEPKRAMRALNAAANLLAEAQRAWRFSGGHPQLAHCERLQRWIADLMALRVEAWQHSDTMILPVYRQLEDDRVELDGATAVDWRRLLPSNGTPSRLVPRQENAEQRKNELPTSDMYYFAVRVQTARQAAGKPPPGSNAKNLVYVETEPVEDTVQRETEKRKPFKFITGKVQGKLIMGNEDKL